jgi:hypothetical protein
MLDLTFIFPQAFQGAKIRLPLTLNQRVPGSSPGAPTNEIKDLAGIHFPLETSRSNARGNGTKSYCWAKERLSGSPNLRAENISAHA